MTQKKGLQSHVQDMQHPLVHMELLACYGAGETGSVKHQLQSSFLEPALGEEDSTDRNKKGNKVILHPFTRASISLGCCLWELQGFFFFFFLIS